MSVTRATKYLYPFVLQGCYGGRWEDLTQEDTRAEAAERRREYRDNEGGEYRIVRRRVPNPAFTGATAEPLYRVVRLYRDRDAKPIIASRLTEAQAQQYCRGPETSSTTATGAAAQRRTARFGPWFYAYERQDAR